MPHNTLLGIIPTQGHKGYCPASRPASVSFSDLAGTGYTGDFQGHGDQSRGLTLGQPGVRGTLLDFMGTVITTGGWGTAIHVHDCEIEGLLCTLIGP